MPSFAAERAFHRHGLTHVAGLDEVGRGAWAGPLVAGAVILPIPTRALRTTLAGVNDSKQLTPHQRTTAARLIQAHAIAFGIGLVQVAEVDALGITAATREAMRRALATLEPPPDALLIDAFPLPASPLPQRAIIRGDSASFSIAAASIIAKVARDELLCALHTAHPAYDFRANKGYGTAAHQQALQQHGVSVAHRQSFAPIRRILATAHTDQQPAESADR